ncbi:hypothetical protein [Pantoea sp. 18069]|uniref:hypothetical protein n=1 Tax=Pantoea sp. 18069 TaxID=2681415 RepID=UPI001358CC23|nr:hypothetical protein [Pantoea sp. 18069]
MLESEKLNALFQLLEEMTRPRASIKTFTPGKIAQCLEKWSMYGFLGTIVVFLVMIAWQRYGTTSPGFRHILLGVYLLHLALSLTYLITVTVGSLSILWRHRKKPFAAMLAALKRDLQQDADTLKELWTFDKATLAYGLLQYRHRWSSFDGRIAMISGDVRKLGLFPALAAVSISAATLLKEDSNLYLWAPVILAACFYLVAFVAHASRERPQQVIELLEYAIQHADQFTSSVRAESNTQALLSGNGEKGAEAPETHNKPLSANEAVTCPATTT